MDILPAIDLRGGRVVRWVEGDALRETPYDDDPLARARAFRQEGAQWLHVVDLDRAFHSGADNDAVVKALCALDDLDVQLGGNITETTFVARAVEWGAQRVVLGTAAAVEPTLLGELVHAVGPERAAVALDVRGGRPALRGGSVPLSVSVNELLDRVQVAGVTTVVHRDLDRDGLLVGADLEGAAGCKRDGVAVIAAGGVDGLDAIVRARALGLAGIIVGRALYEGRFTLTEALACC